MKNTMEEESSSEIKLLLQGVIPECQSEMDEYFKKYSTYIFRCQDRPGFHVEAGPFGILKFTQRSMHQMWILGFAAMEALNSYAGIIKILQSTGEQLDLNILGNHPAITYDQKRYQNLIESVLILNTEENLTSFQWPNRIPSPLNRKPKDINGAAAFDLICMSGAYVFLHEIRHIQFSIEGNSPSDKHEEELECDSFAKEMMLSKIAHYSKKSGDDIKLVRSKRAVSICFALFYMLVLTPRESWSGTESHPSIKARIEILSYELELGDEDNLWMFMATLFLSHLIYVKTNTFLLEFKTTKDLAMSLVSEIENSSNQMFHRTR